MIGKFEEITRARIILELPETATMDDIKFNYRRLIAKWHPDRCTEDETVCREKTHEIIKAYQVIRHYCQNYQFSFKRQEVEKYISHEEWWLRRFGPEP